ncbi:serine/threonine-protein kinase ssp1 [Histoplasma capsulatum]|uniref:Serine/threonine-protein kinase ssp1 n=1 Tax=Ajellomyces capsulatus TaxID=5037 RepID=A0A8A1MCI1_AJECA|nr:serine/threonine-protein kinase ssp1 [Histoplasma capsulatum]
MGRTKESSADSPNNSVSRSRRGSQLSLDSSTLLERQAFDTPARRSRSRRFSLTSGSTSGRMSGGITRQKGTQPDGRPEERRGLAHRLHVFPFRPHSSNASRSSSTNTSSSSLLSLADHAGLEPATTDYTSSYFGTSPSQHSMVPKAPDISNPPLSPLTEHPTLSHRAGHSVNDLPIYPDQSYAVLQSQVHPTRIQPHLRSRSSYPSPYPSSSSGPSWSTSDAGSRGQGWRTTGHTPISSPGLFSSRPANPSPPKSAEGRSSFSYLHPTHLQEPKETHTVEVDRDMLTGNKLINEYEILDELGRGEHGKVKLGRHMRTGKKVAIKIVQRYSKRRRLGKLGNPEDKVKKEVAILKKARHENYLHYQGIIHRDIKPANLLVTRDRRVKISDFGVSYLGRPIRDDDEERVTETDATELDDARELSKTVGTPAFYAPELCYTGSEFETQIGNVPKITGAIDVWSLGVTLYGMIFGRLPFVCDDEYKLFHNIVKNEVFIPRRRLKAVEVEPSSSQTTNPQLVMNSNKRTDDELAYESIDDELCDLLRRLLMKDPAKRITLKEIKHHPWVLRDIPDKQKWIETTDPGYLSKGKRIEVSKEEVTQAVTKMPFIERVRSNVAKWGGSIFGRGKDGRRRAPVLATSATSVSISTSSSSNIASYKTHDNEDLKKKGLFSDDTSQWSPFRITKDGDHAPSHSILPNPLPSEDHGISRRGSTASSSSYRKDQFPDAGRRPNLSDRSSSTFSSADSTKTIRPLITDVAPVRSRATTPVSETLLASSVNGIFGGAGRRLGWGWQSPDRQSQRSPSTDRASIDGDAHSGPVVAVSTTSATGLVQSPDLARGPSSTSLSSLASHDVPTRANTSSHHRSRFHQQLHDAPAESFHVTRETLLRQRMQHQDRSHHAQGAASWFKDSTERGRGGSLPARDTLSSIDTEWHQIGMEQNYMFKHPIGEPITSPPSALTMSSSDELTSGMSHSASHPSIPSVISGASSLSADGFYTYKAEREKELDAFGHIPPLLRTRETVTARKTPSDRTHDDECKYDCDDEDEDEDDESEDEGIVLGKRNSCPFNKSKRIG